MGRATTRQVVTVGLKSVHKIQCFTPCLGVKGSPEERRFRETWPGQKEGLSNRKTKASDTTGFLCLRWVGREEDFHLVAGKGIRRNCLKIKH